MLSVQSPGCAGMERLGVPTRTSLGSPPDERSRIRRMRIDGVNDSYNYNNRQISNNQQFNNFPSPNDLGEGRLGCAGCSRSQAITCPYHVPIPDSEYTRERDIQMRVPYQQAEVIRSYIRPPPNKTVLDVPESSYTRIFSSISMSTICTDSSCSNLVPHNQHVGQSASNLPNNHHHHQQQPPPPPPQKTKPNPIAKFFHKISSSKSPSFSSSSSSSATTSSFQLSSDSSSSASLSSASTLPACDIAIPTASTGGSFNLGKQSRNLPSSATSTPCIGVTVPSGYAVTSYDCGNQLHHNYHHYSSGRSHNLEHLQSRESSSASGTCLTIRVPTPSSSSTQSLASLSSVSSMGSPSPSRINETHRSRSPSFKDSCDRSKQPPNNDTATTLPNTTDSTVDSEEGTNVTGNNSNSANNSQRPSEEGGHI